MPGGVETGSITRRNRVVVRTKSMEEKRVCSMGPMLVILRKSAKEMVAGNKLSSGAQLPGKPSPRKPGNNNQYHSPHTKKGKFAHENSHSSHPANLHPRPDNSSAMSAESTRATYQQDEDGNFVRISANSMSNSTTSMPTFDPCYLPIESVGFRYQLHHVM